MIRIEWMLPLCSVLLFSCSEAAESCGETGCGPVATDGGSTPEPGTRPTARDPNQPDLRVPNISIPVEATVDAGGKPGADDAGTTGFDDWDASSEPSSDGGRSTSLRDSGAVDGSDRPGDGSAPTASNCTGNDECAEETPLCDTEAGVCVECMLEDNAGCDEATPYCVGASNSVARCVECVSELECSGATPLCDNGECVGCGSEADCEGLNGRPYCRDDGECVGCRDYTDCPSEAPLCGEDGQCTGCGGTMDCQRFGLTRICKEESGACVQCLGNRDCVGTEASRCTDNSCVGCESSADCEHHGSIASVCDEETHECVKCLSDSDCSEANASTCVNQECVPCTTDEQCAHIDGKGVCDDGTCVECTGPKDDACAAQTGPGATTHYVCDSLNHECATPSADNEVGSATSCEPCLSDAHCGPGRVCVQTEFDDEVLEGWYCLWERGAQGAPTNCATSGRPYSSSMNGVSSIDGREDLVVCALRVSTCAALEDFRSKQCGDGGNAAAQCGLTGLNDALCRAVSPTNSLCTMPCGNDSDCPQFSTCLLGAFPPYCSM